MMKKFEYKRVIIGTMSDTSYDTGAYINTLNIEGDNGWNLVQIINGVAIMKREIAIPELAKPDTNTHSGDYTIG